MDQQMETMEPLERQPIIRMFHVSKRFEQKAALLDVTLDIFPNDFIFLWGPSGAGKSTFLKLLYLGEPLSQGQILVEGMNLSRINRKTIPQLRQKFGVIFQDFKLIPTKTVYENVALVLAAKGLKGSMIQKKVNQVLGMVGLGEKSDAYPLSLSGGEQQRAAVARAMVGEPGVILADEPTGSLDTASARTIMDLLDQFHADGNTVIMATHDQSLLNRKQCRIFQLDGGRLVNITPVS
ncbi:MAG: ATP-binding cassette domain-containing protein [Proteobacteria bacterium]|nr:ATP-binding cassette domain-containing protein [Pseudomonadota bacterium]MBU4470699.1 ATP-binding cassette domain-containing protein [Pseudomonadota bacterium]